MIRMHDGPSIPRGVVVSFVAVLAGCGPRVDPPSAGEEGSAESGQATTGETTTGATEAVSTGTFDEGSGSPPAFCGNGVVEGNEACDDGNDVDADGCSRLCEASGRVSWRVEFAPESGFGVGLDARDGEAYVLVEDYHFGSTGDVEAISTRVSALGDIVAQYVHPRGLADFDLAREAIAAMPGGEVIVGYPAPGGALARIRLDAGLVWSDPMETWRFSAATRWIDGEVYTLRDAATQPAAFAVVRYTDTGELLDTSWIGNDAIGERPLHVGSLFARAPGRVVALFAGERVSAYISAGENWEVVTFGSSGISRPVALAQGLEIVVWTDTERIVIDELDHVQAPEPRVVLGSVIASFIGGFAIVDGQRVDVYDDAGTLRWSHDAPAVPRRALADDAGGLFVLSDLEVEPGGIVVLERLVL
jgi:cysteine-rich repeat protein